MRKWLKWFYFWLCPILLIVTAPNAITMAPMILLQSLFDPGTNSLRGAENGYRVAIDGNIAVVGAGMAGTVKVYDATTGEFLHLLETWHPTGPLEVGYPVGYPSVAISGTRIAVAQPDVSTKGACV